MYEIQLTGGIGLALPENLSEITGEQFCEWMQGAEEFIKWQNAQVEANTDPFNPAYQLERLRRMMNMIAEFSNGSLAPIPDGHLFRLPAGEFEQSLKFTFGLDRLEDFDFDRTEATLYNIWALIYQVIVSTKFTVGGHPDGFTFSWKGETYKIDHFEMDRFTNSPLPPDITVQEAVEVLELRKKANTLLAQGKHESKNIKWEMYHRQLAILARKEGEQLPTDDLDFERFVSDRALHFLGIDAETLVRADFFLRGRLGLLSDTLTALSFSIPLEAHLFETQESAVS